MKLDYDTAAATLSRLGNVTRLKNVSELMRAGHAAISISNQRWHLKGNTGR